MVIFEVIPANDTILQKYQKHAYSVADCLKIKAYFFGIHHVPIY